MPAAYRTAHGAACRKETLPYDDDIGQLKSMRWMQQHTISYDIPVTLPAFRRVEAGVMEGVTAGRNTKNPAVGKEYDTRRIPAVLAQKPVIVIHPASKLGDENPVQGNDNIISEPRPQNRSFLVHRGRAGVAVLICEWHEIPPYSLRFPSKSAIMNAFRFPHISPIKTPTAQEGSHLHTRR